MIRPARPLGERTEESLEVAEELISDITSNLLRHLRYANEFQTVGGRRYGGRLASSVEEFTGSIMYRSRFEVADVISDQSLERRAAVGYITGLVVHRASQTRKKPFYLGTRQDVNAVLTDFATDYASQLLAFSETPKLEEPV